MGKIMSSVTGATPNLFLVGAPKCGTTSMYEYLRRHPQIFFPKDDSGYGRAKEPQHFCPDLGLSARYAIHDRGEYLSLYEGAGNVKWRGDASTYYLYSRAAPELIREFCPHARILIMLRPPLEMIHSYHSELLRWGQEDIADFHEALAAIEERKQGNRLPRDAGVARCLDYIDVCRLAPQVERYFRTFGRDAVKVVLLEDMVASPAETYREVLRFLDVDPSFQPDFRVYNEAPRNGPSETMLRAIYNLPGVRPVMRALFPYPVRRRVLSYARRSAKGVAQVDSREEELRALYRPGIERLAELIGRDLSHWM
jgi:hypothetical protein